jgi:hypothetical protein
MKTAHSSCLRALIAALPALLLSCESPATGDTLNPRLIEAFDGYQAPANGAPPSANRDAEFNLVIKQVTRIAAQNGWKGDGRKASQNVLLFSRPGEHGPIIVGLYLKRADGKLAFDSASSSNLADFDRAEQLRKDLVKALSQ